MLALAVVLAWQMIVAMLAERAPVEIAVRVAPGSTIALVRAADAEFATSQFEDAAELGRSALRIAPFNARALSIVGRAQDAAGDLDAADQTLTLAGNWSLRDDPTHAWLMNRRLSQGDYASAFAHAETLARRDSPSQPQLYELFTVAGMASPAGLKSLVGALSRSPAWRKSYLASAWIRPDTDQLLADLAVHLEQTSAPLQDVELTGIYRRWLDARQPALIRVLQQSLQRPDLSDGLWNGRFDSDEGVAPLDWSFAVAAGVSAQIVETGEPDRGTALLVETNGATSGTALSQLLLLSPGPATFGIMQRVEVAAPQSDLQWKILCFETGAVLGSWSSGNTLQTKWNKQVHDFSVPASGCEAQWLQLQIIAGDRRRPGRAWFDSVEIAPQRPSDPRGN